VGRGRERERARESIGNARRAATLVEGYTARYLSRVRLKKRAAVEMRIRASTASLADTFEVH
jgi:hypothetical protein